MDNYDVNYAACREECDKYIEKVIHKKSEYLKDSKYGKCEVNHENRLQAQCYLNGETTYYDLVDINYKYQYKRDDGEICYVDPDNNGLYTFFKIILWGPLALLALAAAGSGKKRNRAVERALGR